MTTSTITWTPVAEGLPDVESNVLLGLSSGFTCEGFLDTDHEGAQVWRDVCAIEIEDAVVAWAELPTFDSHADTPEQPAPVPPGWMPIETAPKDGRKIILTYRNANDKPRTVMAVWVTDEEAAETDEDGVGLEAGWYESIDNWDDYSQVAIHAGEPTHWMPLPPPPGLAASPEVRRG